MTGTLEDIVLKHLQQAPSDEDIRQRYRRQYEAVHGPNSSDESDYNDHDFRAVRDRALISALLDAHCEFIGSNAADGDEIEIDLDQLPSPLEEFARIRLDFKHDAERLDNGKQAEKTLAPVPSETITPAPTILAKRKLRIHWLALISLWEKGKQPSYPTRKAVIQEAAKALGVAEGSFYTQLSKFKNGKDVSSADKELFESLRALAESIAEDSNLKEHPFDLMLPAVRALSK